MLNNYLTAWKVQSHLSTSLKAVHSSHLDQSIAKISRLFRYDWFFWPLTRWDLK